jgi:two-component system, OmpR family, response regulator VicR
MPKKILIIEDDPDISEILNDILETEGYNVVLSADGEACRHLSDIMPDLILMDVRLKQPGQNGDAICLQLKSDVNTRCFPIILLSAENDLRALCKACGANGFLSKPFDVDALVCQVRDMIEKNVA